MAQITLAELRVQVTPPLSTIPLDNPLHAFKLLKYLKKLHRAISIKCTQYVQGKPKLPRTENMASIGLAKTGVLVQVCFSMSSLYVTGVLVDDIYYEMKRSGADVGKVIGSIPLGTAGHTYKDFGSLPPIKLTAEVFDAVHCCLSNLGTVSQDLVSAVYALGVFALTIIEPLRQSTIQRRLVGEEGRTKGGTEYTEIENDEDIFWKVIHLWGCNSLSAEGLKSGKGIDGRVVVENHTLDPGQRWSALEEVLILNSSRNVTYRTK